MQQTKIIVTAILFLETNTSISWKYFDIVGHDCRTTSDKTDIIILGFILNKMAHEEITSSNHVIIPMKRYTITKRYSFTCNLSQECVNNSF